MNCLPGQFRTSPHIHFAELSRPMVQECESSVLEGAVEEVCDVCDGFVVEARILWRTVGLLPLVVNCSPSLRAVSATP